MEKVVNRRKRLWLIIPILLSFALISMIPGSSLAQEKKTLLRLGAVPSGSGWYFWLSQTATVINRNLPKVEISVRETGGTRENTIRMSKNELEMGLTEGRSFLLGTVGSDLARYEDRVLIDDSLINKALIYTLATEVGNHVMGLQPCAGTGDSCPYTGLVCGAAQPVMRHLLPDMPGTSAVQPSSYALLLEADSRRLISYALCNGRCHQVDLGNDTTLLRAGIIPCTWLLIMH